MTIEQYPETPTELLIKEGFDGEIYCLQCCAEYIATRDGGMPVDQRPPIQLACTWAPSWQSQSFGGQVVVSCAVVPSCFDHLSNRPRSAEEMAASRGLILGGGRG